MIESVGRGDRIRTCDFYVPNVALYQAELHPESSSRSFYRCNDGLIKLQCRCGNPTPGVTRWFVRVARGAVAVSERVRRGGAYNSGMAGQWVET